MVGYKTLCALVYIFRKQGIYLKQEQQQQQLEIDLYVLTPSNASYLVITILTTQSTKVWKPHQHGTVASFIHDFLMQSFINVNNKYQTVRTSPMATEAIERTLCLRSRKCGLENRA